MTTKHTPGPWTVGCSLDDKTSLTRGDYTVLPLPEDDQIEANARLIAAAPDLLAAMRLAAHTLDFAQSIVTRAVDSDTVFAALTAARAAIAKTEEG